MFALLREFISTLLESPMSISTAHGAGLILYVTDDVRIISFNLIDVNSVSETLKRELDPNERSFRSKLTLALGHATVGSMQIKRNELCNGYEIQRVIAKRGLGPLMYDTAMQYVTSVKNSALMSDRGSVSSAADNIWRYYYNQRGDVSKSEIVGSSKICHDEYFKDRPWLHYKYTQQSSEYENLLNPDLLLDTIAEVVKEELDFDINMKHLEQSIDQSMEMIGLRKFAQGYRP